MSMIFTLKPLGQDNTPGECAHCGKGVSEAQCILDDCYNVWAGKCPFCSAINYLSMNHGLRGYSSVKMYLVLPTPEEAEQNNLPADIPLGPSGGPATCHGSPLGEFLHKLTGKEDHENDTNHN